MKVRGIVASKGGLSRQRGGPYTRPLRLRPWRRASGELVDGEALCWEVFPTREAADTARDALPSRGGLVEVDVDGPDLLPGLDRARREHEFVLRSWLFVDDEELAAFARAVAPAPLIVDEELGPFDFDATVRWYSGRRCTSAGQYRVHVKPVNARESAEALARARRAVEWVDERLDELRGIAADELWETWDRHWRQADESHIDRRAFEARLTLESVTVDEDAPLGTIDLMFDDGQVFGGHGIELSVKDWAVADVGLFG